jgi:hypothetical protein
LSGLSSEPRLSGVTDEGVVKQTNRRPGLSSRAAVRATSLDGVCRSRIRQWNVRGRDAAMPHWTNRTTSVRARQRAELWAGKGVRYCPGRSDFASPIGKRASAIRDGSSPSLPRPWVCPSGLRARRALDGVGQTAVHPAAGARIPGVLSTEPDLNVREDVRLQCQRRAMNALKATAAQPDQRLPTCAKNDLPDGDKLICRSYQEGMTRSSTRKWPARAFAQRGRMTARSGFNCADPYPAVLRLSAVITPTQPPGNH